MLDGLTRRSLLASMVAAAVAPRLRAALDGPEVPPFTWDRVPAYAHLGKSGGDFTEAELDFLAGHFNFITIEKGQAVKTRGSTEEGIYEVARQLKRRNPRMTVLFYWNAFLNYPLYRALKDFKPAWQLRDRNGKEVLKNGRVPRPDLSLPDVQAWWSDVAAGAMKAAPLDGIFADALPQALTPALPRQVGEKKARAVVQGLREMLALTKKKMGSGKIVLANGIRAAQYRQILDWKGIDGVIIEHFGHFRSGDPKSMKADLASLEAVSERGKFTVLKGWPGFDWTNATMMKRPHDELLKRAREQIGFPLACYLVGARTNSWFCYSWGYRESHGTLDAYPELEKPLGAPKGDAAWDGHAAAREFARASVKVNLEAKTARIDWR